MIGERISELRKNKNLTQEELGSRIYVSDKTISSWEQNRTEPSLEDIIKLSEVLECSISFLIYGNINKLDIETEIKIKLTESEYKKLDNDLKNKAKYINENHHIDTYYEPTYKRFFHKGEKVSEWLRIGERGNKIILNYKNWYDVYCDEYEVEIDNKKNMEKILKALNIEELVKVDKKRKTYLYKNKYEFALDIVKDLGYYVEIEIKKYNKTIMEENDELLILAKSFNLNLNNITRKGYPHILLEKTAE